MNVDRLIACARQVIGNARYSFDRERCVGLDTVNCFTFVRELYRCQALDVPSDLGQMLAVGQVVRQRDLKPGHCLLLTARWGGYDLSRKGLFDVGHIALYAGPTMIHASYSQATVIEEPVDWRQVRGALTFTA